MRAVFNTDKLRRAQPVFKKGEGHRESGSKSLLEQLLER